MKRLVVCSLAAWVCLASVGARAEQATPRDLWPQATSAADTGDVDTAMKRTNDLTTAARELGIHILPVYAIAAAAEARQAAREHDKPKTEWAAKAADLLDPHSPYVAFSKADREADAKQYAQAVPAALAGYGRVLTSYRSRLLSQSDSLIVLLATLALTATIFAIALFIRYGRSMAHDFREILSGRFRGGAVTVLAFALLLAPIFLWLGPIWLIFYWFVIFFGYATKVER